MIGVECKLRKNEVHVPEKLTRTIRFLNSLADENRQKIIYLVGTRGRMCVNEITQYFDMSRPAVSHHLKILKDSQLLSAERNGKEIYYSFNKERAIHTLQWLIDFIGKNAS